MGETELKVNNSNTRDCETDSLRLSLRATGIALGFEFDFKWWVTLMVIVAATRWSGHRIMVH